MVVLYDRALYSSHPNIYVVFQSFHSDPDEKRREGDLRERGISMGISQSRLAVVARNDNTTNNDQRQHHHPCESSIIPVLSAIMFTPLFTTKILRTIFHQKPNFVLFLQLL
jgi:hypothetical protein